MAAHWLFCFALLILFLAPHLSKSDELPHFGFSWPDDDDEFYTNDTVAIKVQVPENFKPDDFKFPFNPNISVNDTKGNSSYITDVHSNCGNDTNNWQILFKTIMAGFFHVLITEDNFTVHDTSLHFHVTPAELYIPPKFSFDWPGYKRNFKAGEPASLSVTTSENFNTKMYKVPFNPNLTVSMEGKGQDERTGNSIFISGVYNDLGNDTSKFRLHFIPIMSGKFNMWVSQFNLGLGWKYMSYEATPAEIYVPGGIVSWEDNEDYFVAGTKAIVKILPKDAFGNTVTIETEGGSKMYDYTVFATNLNNSNARVVDVNNKGWNGNGYITIEFTVITSGTLLLHVKNENLELVGSPLTFTVDPGPIDVGNCMPEWPRATKHFQLFSTMETLIIQRDRFGNLAPGFHDFDFGFVEKHTSLSVPIKDLKCQQVAPGVQSYTFKPLTPGEFLLFITDKVTKKRILNIPYEFDIYIGSCDGHASIVNGSGLESSIVGEVSKIYMFLRDAYDYPSPVETHRLRVEITAPSLSLKCDTKISPIVNGTQSTGMLDFSAYNPSVPFVYSQSGESSTVLQSAFEVEYVPEKMGNYEVRAFCGNIPLSDGYAYTKWVGGSDKVNITNSRVYYYEKHARVNYLNAIQIQLNDFYNNPVVLGRDDSRMSTFKIESKLPIGPDFGFSNQLDGTYLGSYMALVLAQYSLCTYFDGNAINPCPFLIDIYTAISFPESYDDEVSCWEDESVGFDALSNDYVERGSKKILEFQKPRHGSLVKYGETFRYTPYKRFYGNDSFTYKMIGLNPNCYSSSKVYVFVLAIPPQLGTYPSKLHADEDMLSPKFGGFSGFELTYSNSKENFSVSISATNGSVLLSPLLIQLWDPMWDELSVTRKNNELILTARLEVINFAINSLKYIGKGNYSGEDTIRITTINKSGKRDLDIPMVVNPINDPPFINAPQFIMLGNVTEDEGYLIYDTQRDNYTFSIGDPDFASFPGPKSHFRVMLSVEVSSGYFSTSLPAVLISTTELKLKNSDQWQPLHTFVEISKLTTVKARAIRFRATIDECNNILQQILYYANEKDGVRKRGGVLKVSVNDMGWYGCYPDCEEMMSSMPLITEATIKLVTKKPVQPVVAHSLGSVIVIVSILLTMLAVMLIFFTCKCIYLLLDRKVNNQGQYQNFQPFADMSSTDSSDAENENMTGEPSSLSNPLLEESGAN